MQYKHRRKLLALLAVVLMGTHLRINDTRAQTETPPAAEILTERQPTETPPPAEAAPEVDSRPAFQPQSTDDAAPQGRIGIASANANLAVDAFITPSDIRAGDAVTYTYRYTNTTGATISNASALLTWSAMRATDVVADNAQIQFCNTTCLPVNVSGPAVTFVEADSFGNNIRFAIGALTAGAAGQFSIVLRTRATVYPKTGLPPTRPATSVQLFEGAATVATVVDTTSALVVGPVLVLSKAPAAGSPPRIAVGESVDFAITVGNATGAGDTPDGVVRADARTATNLVIVDRVPDGAVYVPTTDPPGITRQFANGTITWTIASLAPQNTNAVTVRFRKPTSQSDLLGCTQLENNIYNTSSNEYPFQSATQRYRVDGRTASIPVVAAMDIATMSFVPTVGLFNESVSVTLVVRNHYTQTISGARVIFATPPNARYVSASATPSLGAGEPANPQPGQSITWTVNMPAGSAVAPSMLTVTFRLKPETVSAFEQVNARVQVPSGVPAGCLQPKYDYFNSQPRLAINVTRWPANAPELIDAARPYTFALEISNNGQLTVTNATITAALPFNSVFPADFVYSPGSATLNDSPREPNTIANGNGGHLVWRNVTINPRNTIRILFTVIPNGFEFVRYCMGGSVSSPIDPLVVYNGSFTNCLRINPPLQMSKVSDRDYVTDMSTQSGREVTFTLMITNTGTHSYHMGLMDIPGDLEFVRQVSSNNGTPTYQPPNSVTGTPGLHRWPLRDVLPGQRLEAVVVFRIPTSSNSFGVRTFDNELGFRFREYTGAEVYVVQIPPVIKRVSERGILYYSAKTEQAVYGPRDRIKLIFDLVNASSAQPMTSIDVRDILPAGFTFDSMAPESDFNNAPAISTGPNGRQQLSWQLTTIPPQTTRRLIAYIRAPSIIGSFENWGTVSTPTGLYDVRCQSSGSAICSTMSENGTAVPISLYAIAIDALATLEPALIPDACVLPSDTVQYRLSMVNTNNHAYGNTLVTFQLPYGVSVIDYSTSNSSGIVTLPSFTTEPDGSTTVTWSDINLPAKPLFGAPSSQIVFFLTLGIGRFAGNVPIIATASSPDGDILRKDDVLDPALRTCPQGQVVMMKESSRTGASANEDVIWQVSLVNPLASAIAVTVSDALPAPFVYQATLVGPAPAINGQTLRWNNVSVPAAANGVPGTTVMRFRTRVVAAPQAGIYRNTATLVSASANAQPVNQDLSWTEVEVFGIPPTPTPTPTLRPFSSPTPFPTWTPTNTPPPGSTPTHTPQPNVTPSATIRPIVTATPRATSTLLPGQPTHTPDPNQPTAQVTPQPTINPTTLASLTKKTWLPVMSRK
jgi:hypothetical protein